MPLKYKGVVDARDYTLEEKCHLIECVGKWGGNLYVWYRFSWESAYESLTADDRHAFFRLAEACREAGVAFWVGMKPGDFRYCMHGVDRQRFRDNALWFVKNGADGFYVPMDDTHPGGKIAPKDGIYQAQLIAELALDLGNRLKGICGEEYFGRKMRHTDYWQPILEVLPKNVMITWTGPRIWNSALSAEDMPRFEWPVLLWENYFASDSPEPEHAPAYPYEGRSPDLPDVIDGFLLHPNIHYPWQYCALRTTFAFLAQPNTYDSQRSFRQAILELGDLWWKEQKASKGACTENPPGSIR
ncbi:MAG: beta-N-acetylglucosaminidase domain-containing protein [Opitutales bacterium]|nr:beta-N-acetylglucosaminidase domain-containing protein [Opitutales bacterium]